MNFPKPRDDDPEDVAWALSTAESFWRRGERNDAITWVRRAAQAAAESERDDRVLELARAAAELADAEIHTPAPRMEQIAPQMAQLAPRVPTATNADVTQQTGIAPVAATSSEEFAGSEKREFTQFASGEGEIELDPADLEDQPSPRSGHIPTPNSFPSLLVELRADLQDSVGAPFTAPTKFTSGESDRELVLVRDAMPRDLTIVERERSSTTPHTLEIGEDTSPSSDDLLPIEPPPPDFTPTPGPMRVALAVDPRLHETAEAVFGRGAGPTRESIVDRAREAAVSAQSRPARVQPDKRASELTPSLGYSVIARDPEPALELDDEELSIPPPSILPAPGVGSGEAFEANSRSSPPANVSRSISHVPSAISPEAVFLLTSATAQAIPLAPRLPSISTPVAQPSEPLSSPTRPKDATISSVRTGAPAEFTDPPKGRENGEFTDLRSVGHDKELFGPATTTPHSRSALTSLEDHPTSFKVGSSQFPRPATIPPAFQSTPSVREVPAALLVTPSVKLPPVLQKQEENVPFVELADEIRESLATLGMAAVLLPDEEEDAPPVVFVTHGSLEVRAKHHPTVIGTVKKGEVRQLSARSPCCTDLVIRGAAKGARYLSLPENALTVLSDEMRGELSSESDDLHVIAGVLHGRLGKRLEGPMLLRVVHRAETLRLGPNAKVVQQGEVVTAFVALGGGELSLRTSNAVDAVEIGTVELGEVLYPRELLTKGVAPATVRAGKQGALVLVSTRRMTEELLVNVPELLEMLGDG